MVNVNESIHEGKKEEIILVFRAIFFSIFMNIIAIILSFFAGYLSMIDDFRHKGFHSLCVYFPSTISCRNISFLFNFQPNLYYV